MDIVIDAGKDNDGGFDLKVDGEVERRNIITPDYSAEIRESINKRFREVVPAMTMDIRDKLQGTGAFTFPGSGVFSFRDPRLTRWGDIVTQIDYLPFVSSFAVDEQILTSLAGSNPAGWSSFPGRVNQRIPRIHPKRSRNLYLPPNQASLP